MLQKIRRVVTHLRSRGYQAPLRELKFVFALGGGHRNLEKKAVLLCFWKRIRALMLDGVLRCEHHEHRRQRAALAIDRYLPLLHRFQ